MELVFDISDLEGKNIEALRQKHPDWPQEAVNQVWAQRGEILKQHLAMIDEPGYQKKVQFRYWDCNGEVKKAL